MDAAILSRQHGVGDGAGGDDDRSGRQAGLASFGGLDLEAAGRAEAIDFDGYRRELLGEADAFLERLGHFLVVAIGGALGQRAAIGDGGAAPALQQLQHARQAAGAQGFGLLGADGARMGEELVGDQRLFLVIGGADGLLALFGGQRLVAGQEFLDLDRIIGQRLGAAVDRGQAAADHHHGQAQLQIGQAVGAGRPRQLQRHQEIRGLAHAARQIVRHGDDGGFAGTHAQRHMVEAHLEGLVQGDGAAQPDAAQHQELGAALQHQADHLEEVLVPADGDAVFGDAAEAGHDALG